MHPPPTDEHRQRVRIVLEALQASARSPNPTSNILYPPPAQSAPNTTQAHTARVTNTHASVSIWQRPWEAASTCAVLSFCTSLHFKRKPRRGSWTSASLWKKRPTQLRSAAALRPPFANPKGRVHPSSGLTDSRTRSFFASPTRAHVHISQPTTVQLVSLSFLLSMGKGVCPITVDKSKRNTEIKIPVNVPTTRHTEHDFRVKLCLKKCLCHACYLTTVHNPLTLVIRRVGDVFLCVSDFVLKWGRCSSDKPRYPAVSSAFCSYFFCSQPRCQARLLFQGVWSAVLSFNGPTPIKRPGSCSTSPVIFMAAREILPLRGDNSGQGERCPYICHFKTICYISHSLTSYRAGLLSDKYKYSASQTMQIKDDFNLKYKYLWLMSQVE